MSLLRQKTLNDLYNVLKTPERYGDKFLVKITQAPKDGLVSVDLLRNMATVLNEYPSEYLAHCIPLDEKDRFVYNSDISRVGLKENVQFFETDPYGFMQQSDQSDDQQCLDVQPVIYDNGRFYIDNEHTRAQNQHTGKQLPVYQYDLLDMEPLGKRHFEDLYLADVRGECFNCGSTEHTISACPLPRNVTRIGKKKREHRETHTRNFFDALPLYQLKPGQLSDSLKEALGILKDGSEPPYYRNMRYFGYPPGYIEKEDPILKIYDQDGNEVKEDTVEPSPFSSGNNQTVEYPGLNLQQEVSYEPDWNAQQQWYAYQQHVDYQHQWEEYWNEQARQWNEFNQNNLSYQPQPVQQESKNKPIITSDDQSVDMDLSSDEEDT